MGRGVVKASDFELVHRFSLQAIKPAKPFPSTLSREYPARPLGSRSGMPTGFREKRNDDSIVPLRMDTRMPSNPRLKGEKGGRRMTWISCATEHSKISRSINSGGFVESEIRRVAQPIERATDEQFGHF